MAVGALGAPDTTRVLGTLDPQALIETTLSVQVPKLPGQSTRTLLRLVGPPMLPQLTVQLYPVAPLTGRIE